MGKYDEMSVVRALSKNPNVKVTTGVKNSKFVEVVKNSTYVGNKTWGKIDYLTRHCGYILHFVDINAQIAAKQAEKAAKKQAAKDAKAARKGITDEMTKGVKKVMKMKK